MFLALESLQTEALNTEMEAAAILSPSSRYIDSYMARIGLESSTYLKTMISQEGVFEWVKEKLSNLGRKITLTVNKIYAKFPGVDRETKELIRKASNDKTVKLPISSKKLTVIAAIATAISAAIMYSCQSAAGGDETIETKAKVAYNKVKEMLSKLGGMKSEGEEVEAGVVKKAVNIIREAIGNISKTLKEFLGKFKNTVSAAENTSKEGGDSNKSSIINRVKAMAGSVRRIFGLFGDFFTKCCGWMYHAASDKVAHK